jgi:hypothetical protein
MNRRIWIGLSTAFFAISMAGCAVDAGSDDAVEAAEVVESPSGVEFDPTTGERRSATGEPLLLHAAATSEGEDRAGPFPDPWHRAGPFPDPWHFRTAGTGSSSSGGSNEDPNKKP